MNSEYDPVSSEGAVSQAPTPPNSPVQEQHIDFLLEEEFACNSDFLNFFVEAAKEHFRPMNDEVEDTKLIQPCSEWNCKAIRSVTTGKGETDVLAIYHSVEKEKVAILIENKIRAGFQRDQPERYRQRGEDGKNSGHWDFYWTCLISPEKYAQGNEGFDTRLSLEKLATFFSGEDSRSRFKSGVIQRALRHFAETGLQTKDETMTRFRAFYAQEAACFFGEGDVNWPKARDAWWGDTWFNFKGAGIPAGAEIVHKSEAGFVDLAFPNTKVDLLEKALAKCPHLSEIIARQTHKSASLSIRVKLISDFSDHAAAKPVLMESFRRIRDLIAFYNLNKQLIIDEIAISRQLDP
jgi:hypothetical protein